MARKGRTEHSRAGQDRTGQGKVRQCKAIRNEAWYRAIKHNSTGGGAGQCRTGRRARQSQARWRISCLFFCIIPFIFNFILICIKSVFFWDAVVENSAGLRPNGKGLRPKMGRSQNVEISPGIWSEFYEIYNRSACKKRSNEKNLDEA